MSQYPNSIPPKHLAQGITSASTSFMLDNILQWDGSTNLAAADFGTVAYGVFRNPENTQVEFFSWDPATVASSAITILSRGLDYAGADPTASDAARKLDWPAYDTIVELGSHPPQLFHEYLTKSRDETKTGLLTVTQFPVKSGITTPTAAGELATKGYVDATATGAATYDQQIISGTSGEILTAGQLVYFKSSDQKWWLADLDTSSTYKNVQLGFAQSSVAADAAVNVLISGLEKNQSGLTPGSDYFASATAGAIQATVAASKERCFVGRAKSATVLQVNFRQTDQVLAHSLQNGEHVYAASSAGTDAYAITVSPIPIAYSAGQAFTFKADVANSGTATLNVNGLGAVTIKKLGATALVTGDIAAGQVVTVVHDGTDFQMVSGYPTQVVNIQQQMTAGEAISAADAVVLTLDSLAIDATSNSNITAGNATLTQAHTCASTSLNTVLTIWVADQGEGNLTTVEYAGVAMTLIDSFSFGASGDMKISAYYLIAPTAGTNNIVVTRSNTAFNMEVFGVSLTGAHQTTPIDVSDKSSAVSDQTLSAVTTVNYGRPIVIVFDDNLDYPAGSLVNLVDSGLGIQTKLYYKSGYPVVTPAGTFSCSFGGSGNTGGIMAIVKPASTTSFVLRKADADVLQYTQPFVGFAASSIANGATGPVSVAGVAGGFVGLTTGSYYYISATAGAVATSSGTFYRLVGLAVSTTEMLIINSGSSEQPTGVANWQPIAATSGTDTTPANDTQFVTSVNVPSGMKCTNVNYLIGSVGGTNRVYAVIYDSSGNVVANTTLASSGTVVGTAANIQTLALTSPAMLKPGRYFVGISMNGNTARLRTIPAFCQAGNLGGTVTQTHASVAAITPPSTFTADQAPVVFLN